MGLEIK